MFTVKNSLGQINLVKISIGITTALILVGVFIPQKKSVKKIEKICYYSVKNLVNSKSITCTTLVSREQCGLFLKDCDSEITGVNCATNVSYYCH